MKKLILAFTFLSSIHGFSQIIEYQNLRVSAALGGTFQSTDFFSFGSSLHEETISLSKSVSVEYRTRFNGKFFVGISATSFDASSNNSAASIINYYPDASSKWVEGTSSSKVNSIGPVFTNKIKTGRLMSSIYFSYSPFFERGSYEFNGDGQLLSSAKSNGVGAYFQSGYDYFITDNFSFSLSSRMAYTHILDVKETQFKELNSNFDLENRIAISIFATLRFYY